MLIDALVRFGPALCVRCGCLMSTRRRAREERSPPSRCSAALVQIGAVAGAVSLEGSLAWPPGGQLGPGARRGWSVDYTGLRGFYDMGMEVPAPGAESIAAALEAQTRPAAGEISRGSRRSAGFVNHIEPGRVPPLLVRLPKEPYARHTGSPEHARGFLRAPVRAGASRRRDALLVLIMALQPGPCGSSRRRCPRVQAGRPKYPAAAPTGPRP